ncbi:MAG: hypothetical protein M1819_001949 [Sarea resinae]|nr:MAG: hypothetical protein M1819_001949 [Sarea resinae]
MGSSTAAYEFGDVVIPKTCKAGVVVNEGPDFTVRIEEVPVPEPGPGEVLIKINITGLCASDIHYMKNDLGLPKMSNFGVRSPGHEGAGVVVKLGANVDNVKVGDRAGTYQQYVISPAKYTTPIPDGVPDEVAALRPGDWAVFPGGGGGVGIQGVQLAKAMGFRPIAVDSGAEKRALCLKLGAEAFVDFRETENVAQEVVRISDGKGAHSVFVTAPQAYRDAVAYTGCRIAARVMCIGLRLFRLFPHGGFNTDELLLAPPNTVMLGADPCDLCFRNLGISGTLVSSRSDIMKTLDFARRVSPFPLQPGQRFAFVRPARFIPESFQKFPIDQLPEALKRLKAGAVAGRCIIDFNA